MNKLKERLKDWLDWDGAAFEVGACLGFWNEFGSCKSEDGYIEDHWNGTKGIFWSDNPLGTALHNFLLDLVKEGMLETKDDNLCFRWNINYKGKLK